MAGRKILKSTVAALVLLAGMALAVPAEAQEHKQAGASASPPLAAFVQGKERLPHNYEGVDGPAFFNAFKKGMGSLHKRKGETIEQFMIRASDMDKVFKPISTRLTYAFKVPGLSGRYSTSKQAYVFGGKHGYGCTASGFREGYVTCVLGEYVESGKVPDRASAGTRVNKRANTAREVHGLAIPLDSRLLQDYFKLDRNRFYFDRTLPAPQPKDRRVSVLFVGNVLVDRFVDDAGQPLQPVIRERRAAKNSEYDVPFNVTRIIFYVQQTGEIVEQVAL